MPRFADFTVTITPEPEEPLLVAYATRDGSAVVGVDYLFKEGELIFSPGDGERHVFVEVLDTTHGGDFYLDVTWTDRTGKIVNRGTGMACLEYTPAYSGGGGGGGPGSVGGDGEPIVPDTTYVLSISDGQLQDPTTGFFIVNVYPPPPRSMSVSFSTRNGTALAGVDYTAHSGVYVLGVGESSFTRDVGILLEGTGKTLLMDVDWVAPQADQIVTRYTGQLTLPLVEPPGPDPEPPGATSEYYTTYNWVTTANVTVPLPNGNAGDLLVVVFAGGFAGGDFSPPAGWTMRHQYIEYEYMAVAYKVREANEPTPTFTRASMTKGGYFCYNFFTTGRPMPNQLDDSNHQSITSPHASYICAGITLTEKHSLVLFMTVARQWDNVFTTYLTGPDSSMGVEFSEGMLSASGTVSGVFTYNKWFQIGAAYDTGVPFNHRCYAVWWGGEGDTGQVAYPCPMGNTRSTSFLLGFRVPG